MPEERIENSVFISYRRTNTPWALAIYQALQAQGYDAFLDFTGIASGDFERVIIQNIRARAHFVVLLTPSALERCGEPGDWFRREIETAIDCKRNIVPIMLEAFDFNSPAIARELTGKLEVLKHYNGLEVPVRYFNYAMKELHERFLSVPLSTVLHPVQATVALATGTEQMAASAAPPVRQEELTAQQWFERGSNATDPDEKIRNYSEAIRLKPDYVSAFFFRGIARKANDDLDGSIADFSEAIRLEPDFGNAFLLRGFARESKVDLDGAIADFSEAIRIEPRDATKRRFRGEARRKKGDLDGAIADFSEAIRLEPDFGDAFLLRGFARRTKGDLDGAIADFSEAIRLKPDYGAAYFNRAVTKRKKGDAAGAQSDFDVAKSLGLKP